MSGSSRKTSSGSWGSTILAVIIAVATIGAARCNVEQERTCMTTCRSLDPNYLGFYKTPNSKGCGNSESERCRCYLLTAIPDEEDGSTPAP